MMGRVVVLGVAKDEFGQVGPDVMSVMGEHVGPCRGTDGAEAEENAVEQLIRAAADVVLTGAMMLPSALAATPMTVLIMESVWIEEGFCANGERSLPGRAT